VNLFLFIYDIEFAGKYIKVSQITQNGEVRLDPKRDIILFDNPSTTV